MNSVKYQGYTIYEDGKIMGLYKKEVKKRINNGRYEVRIMIDGVRKNFIVARLMYYVFIGFDIDNKDLCVIQKDDDYLNIHIDNLDVVHRKDLIQGEKHKNRSKVTDEQVEEIRKLYKGKVGSNQFDKVGYSLNDIAKMYGVTKSNVMHIVKGLSRNEDEYKLK